MAGLCEMAPVKAGLLGSTVLLNSNQNKMCIFTALPIEIRSRSNKYSEGRCSQIIWDKWNGKVCVCVNQNTSLWCCLAGGVAPLWGEPWGCSVLQMLRTASLAAQQHSRVYLRSYSPSWHACIQAGVYYFIAACFRAGLGSRVSAWGFPCLWTALEVFVVQVLLPGGSSHMVALDWVPQGKVLLESSPRGFGCPVV